MHCRYAFCTGTVLFNFILQVGAHIIITSTLYIKLYNIHLFKCLFPYNIDICLIFGLPSNGGIQGQQRLLCGPFSLVILTFKTMLNTLLHYTKYSYTHWLLDTCFWGISGITLSHTGRIWGEKAMEAHTNQCEGKKSL